MADFGDTGSWDLGYNLFFDKWLGTNFINSSVSMVSIYRPRFWTELFSSMSLDNHSADEQDEVAHDGHFLRIWYTVRQHGRVLHNILSVPRLFPIYLETDGLHIHGQPPAWQMFAAAVASDSTIRDSLISLVHAHAGTNVSATLGPFPNVYDPTTNQQWEISTSASTGNGSGARSVSYTSLYCSGQISNFFLSHHSPAQGATYAFLALEYVFIPLTILNLN